MKKKERQAILTKIVREHLVHTQEELQEYLHEYGVGTTQATLSRDLRELKITKMRDEYGKSRYIKLTTETRGDAKQRLYSALKTVTKSIEVLEFLVIIHTSPSYGNFLAAALDELRHSTPIEILGTLAGHDTVVAFCRDAAQAQEMADYLSSRV
ncbi:arginine repressor [Lapidilactobacillus achengensis]|uniref:Arginine repressor n=1 Tax=Lapidilactobacillus achengensis TaxID=2486000 RepID=A0ABW1UQY7_9LACO|nr:ArgR family transcriptional regulator [Lapidilactobacillus achengensis]